VLPPPEKLLLVGRLELEEIGALELMAVEEESILLESSARELDGTIDDCPPTLADDDFPLSLEQDAITRVAAMPAIRVNLLNDFFITRYYRQNSTNFKDPLIKVGQRMEVFWLPCWCKIPSGE
jgi:hypothetical protein